ncbi:hypothetical protein JQ615_18105 [Bradyrhizobium jicamae]|uniref:Uncharacterized protein n=1 Tax=Bradyrhizobium jicamae TaxID=280332 RepID=A0ABS5FKI8_9BRAD|nr:hypothetical protein [Bradyrhizobium jicamae]MBR0797305.1 hypothetical protein [Bradyrhizobium jicamae]
MGIRTNMLHDNFTRELKELIDRANDAGIDGRDLIGLVNDQVFNLDQELKRGGLDMDLELPGWRDHPWRETVPEQRHSKTASALSHDIYRRTAADPYLKDLREFSRRSWRLDGQEEDWTHENIWRFADGAEARVNGKGANELAIPANPGFEVIVYNPNETTPTRAAIVGWRLPGDGDVLPIMVGDDCDYRRSANYIGIVHPDKRIAWGGNWFDDESGFIGAVHDRLEQQRRKRCPSCGRAPCTTNPDDDIPF